MIEIIIKKLRRILPMGKGPLSNEELRSEMVERLERQKLVKSHRVREAMMKVPRHLFVPEVYRERAYEDIPLHIGEGQTISAPHMVAIMTEALEVEPWHRVLEVGAGSGYHACVVGCIAKEVYAIERIESLAEKARKNVEKAECCKNIEVVVGDGSKGYAKASPYDRIFVTAGAPGVPPSLKNQLKLGGQLLVPVGSRDSQVLVRVTRQEEESYDQESLGGCVFVPLLGEEGW